MIPALAAAALMTLALASSGGNGAPELPSGSVGGSCVPASVGPPSAEPWAQLLLDPSRAWSLTTGAGVTVAVVDSGVQADAPQLSGQVAAGLDVTAASGRADADCVGHGTFVAGIVAAREQTGSPFTGLAPGARILPIRVTGADGTATADSLAAGIRAAVDGGARVVNVSAVSTLPSANLQQAVEYAQRRGALIVAAAANDAARNNPVTYPAAYPGVLGVGAVDASGAPAAFSESGPFVSLAAPGVSVTSVGAHGGYFSGSGTSFAAPFVSGAAALVWAYHPELTATQVAARLEVTADPPADPSNQGYGRGIVDPYNAVTAVLPADGAPPPARAAPPHLSLVPPSVAPASGQRAIALGIAGAVAILCLTGAVLKVVVPRGRARRWRAD